MYRRLGNLTEVCSNGGWGTWVVHKVPDARKRRGSQDPLAMILAEIPNKGESEPVETIWKG